MKAQWLGNSEENYPVGFIRGKKDEIGRVQKNNEKA